MRSFTIPERLGLLVSEPRAGTAAVLFAAVLFADGHVDEAALVETPHSPPGGLSEGDFVLFRAARGRRSARGAGVKTARPIGRKLYDLREEAEALLARAWFHYNGQAWAERSGDYLPQRLREARLFHRTGPDEQAGLAEARRREQNPSPGVLRGRAGED